jgi:hypothetical protein
VTTCNSIPSIATKSYIMMFIMMMMKKKLPPHCEDGGRWPQLSVVGVTGRDVPVLDVTVLSQNKNLVRFVCFVNSFFLIGLQLFFCIYELLLLVFDSADKK